jgi:uncharacterized membrane protein
MPTTQHSIEVHIPIRSVYNQWTQFESFPNFMEGVESITQLSDDRTRWETNIGGQHKEFEARIVEQKPEERIAWKSDGDPEHGGVVTFHRIEEACTRISLQMDYQTEGLNEKIGDALGMVDRRIHGDLKRFKEYIEGQGTEDGAWRG